MTRKTIGCVECGASVPYGRLSCPACGALLASVAGGRGPVPASVVAAPADPVAPVGDPPAPAPIEPEADAASPIWPPMTAPSGPAMPARRYRKPGTTPADRSDRDDREPPPPGAYLPPTMTLAAAGSGAMQPSWPGARSVAGVRSAATRKAVVPSETATADHAEATEATRFVEVADWFVIIGASLAVLGFLLPWSVTVIGSSGFGGYFDNWGLASPTHLVILVALLVALALGLLETPVPAWLGTGVLGLALGGLLVGLIWPYAIGPLGADIGAVIVGLGGLALVIGGALACRATRHSEADPLV